jgi:hypothetical protein
MAEPARAKNGRFVKRRGAVSKRTTGAPDAAGPVTTAPPEGVVKLALLTIAIVLAVLGFALSILWVGALVVMGVLWGVLVAERSQRRGSAKGLAAELVTTVVEEAKGVMDATSAPKSDPGSTEGRRGD